MSKRSKVEDAESERSCYPALTVVMLVCRRSPQVDTIHVVASTISSFICSIGVTWTLETASRCVFVRLLGQIGQNEWVGVNNRFRRKRLKHAISDLFGYYSNATVETLEWWLTRYLPERFDALVGYVFQYAVNNNRLDVIQWLHAQGKLILNGTLTEDDIDVFCCCPEIAYWLHEHADGFGLKLSLSLCTYGIFPFPSMGDRAQGPI